MPGREGMFQKQGVGIQYGAVPLPTQYQGQDRIHGWLGWGKGGKVFGWVIGIGTKNLSQRWRKQAINHGTGRVWYITLHCKIGSKKFNTKYLITFKEYVDAINSNSSKAGYHPKII